MHGDFDEDEFDEGEDCCPDCGADFSEDCDEDCPSWEDEDE